MQEQRASDLHARSDADVYIGMEVVGGTIEYIEPPFYISHFPMIKVPVDFGFILGRALQV